MWNKRVDILKYMEVTLLKVETNACNMHSD